MTIVFLFTAGFAVMAGSTRVEEPSYEVVRKEGGFFRQLQSSMDSVDVPAERGVGGC